MKNNGGERELDASESDTELTQGKPQGIVWVMMISGTYREFVRPMRIG